jgi:pSer/pThr/pTyr-binding forkhead associated (FHA) protein
MSFMPEEEAEDESLSLDGLRIAGPALVVRAGGGRAGETFALEHDRTSLGRAPECEVFLDDVTVSRRHSVITRGPDGFTLHDEGSLNGTYVNRRRADRTVLADGDELQIGKYKLTFIVP